MISKLEDTKIKCLSILQIMKVKDYLHLVNDIYKDQDGGIQGQRAPLKTKTAQTIRERMVKDIADGAILPPLVIGVEVSTDGYNAIKESPDFVADIMSYINSPSEQLSLINSSFSIIDGMQRTTALIEAIELAGDSISNSDIRVEFWISTSLNSLIYRMLVLNTGQVPWDMKRQLNTIYNPIVKSLRENIPQMDIKILDETGRRADGGQHQSSKLIEYFLCFTSRKSEVDIKEKVAEDFARMEAIAATSDSALLDNFIKVISIFVKLDNIISKSELVSDSGKFKKGKDLFTSVTAGAGFIAAAAEYIYGPPGFELDAEEILTNSENWHNNMNVFLARVDEYDVETLNNFLQLELLNEKISSRSGKIGTFERDFFHKAFNALFKYCDKLEDLKPCWMAR